MSHRNIRGAAAQFFQEDEDDESDYHRTSGGRNLSSGIYSSGGGGTRPRNDQAFEPNDYKDEEKVAELLTKATVTSVESDKLQSLMLVKDTIVNKQPALLDNFLDEMLNFLTDNNVDIRCYILEFIEEACKTDPETIPKVLNNMMLMLQDKSVSVQKKAIQVTAKIYKQTLIWLSRSKTVTEDMENAWSSVCDLKKFILKQIDSDYDGIRTHTVKFIETIIILQTPTETDSVSRPNDFCVDHVPITVKVARPRKLEEDAKNLFEDLLKFHGSRHATSVNLMTCMGSIVLISKLRPHFMIKVVSAMEKLNAILPPTLERSQVASVRKYMKVQLIGLLKHPRAVDYFDNITSLLTDLGATHQELYKALPHLDEMRSERRKRQRAQEKEAESIKRKRARLELEKQAQAAAEEEEEDEEDYDDDEIEEMDTETQPSHDTPESELEKDIFSKLTPEVAADFVLAYLDKIPDELPPHFMSSYTPVALAGTNSQIRHVSRLLAAQITAFKLGPTAALTQTDHGESKSIPTLVSSTNLPVPDSMSAKLPAPAALPKKKIPKSLKLSEVTKPLSPSDREKHMTLAVKRILSSGERLNETKVKLISSILAMSTFQLRFYVLQHIKEDIRNRLDLGLDWIFAEYEMSQDFVRKSISVEIESLSGQDRYEWTFSNIMKAILESNLGSDKSLLAWRLYMEPPSIPDRGLELLKLLCIDSDNCGKGMQLLMELATKRPRKLHFLSAMLGFCTHSCDDVRTSAVECVMKLYESAENMRAAIQDHAISYYLNSLVQSQPPEILFTEELGRSERQIEWKEELVKSSLHLFLHLLGIKNHLIHELAKVYSDASGDVKRFILRYIDGPIRKIGIDSPDLIDLLDKFPKGAETLITRIVHILTDKALPTPALVQKIRSLYPKKIGDIRFLIPILNGLTKQELISFLPRLVKLNPNVVKEVFNRLLGVNVDSKTHTSPITPVELMVALHQLDTQGVELKSVMKAASMCLGESSVYTAEVMAVVINQLLEMNPLPTLLMRTVIQTMGFHVKLSGFILNTLGRLVGKQVWTQPIIWEGFIKCCQRNAPKSFPILLTLPPTQLSQVLQEAPDLRVPLADHLMSFSQQQRSCMPPQQLRIILGDWKDHGHDGSYYDGYHGNSGMVNIKTEPGSPGTNDLSIVVKEEYMGD